LPFTPSSHCRVLIAAPARNPVSGRRSLQRGLSYDALFAPAQVIPSRGVVKSERLSRQNIENRGAGRRLPAAAAVAGLYNVGDANIVISSTYSRCRTARNAKCHAQNSVLNSSGRKL
jgi:hypothetical protein